MIDKAAGGLLRVGKDVANASTRPPHSAVLRGWLSGSSDAKSCLLSAKSWLCKFERGYDGEGRVLLEFCLQLIEVSTSGAVCMPSIIG